MPNEKNLMPIQEVNSSRTREQHSEDSRKGGVASGVSRRRKRSLKEAADLFLSLPVTDTRTFNKMVKAGLNTDEIDYQMAVIVGLTLQAAKGDAKAAKAVFELLGDDARVDTNTEDDPLTKAIDEAVNNGLFGEASTNPDIPEDE